MDPPPPPISLARWLERHAAFAPDKAAIRFEEETITYAMLDRRVRALSAGLHHELRIARGDRVALLGLNSPDLIALLFACARLGALMVPLNSRLAAPEHQALLDDADVQALVCEPGFRDHVTPFRKRYPDCRFVACGFADDGWTSLDQLLVRPGEVPESGTAADPLLIVYTSGTTGRPKGALLSQAALLWNAINSAHMHDLTSTDHVLTVLPLFHVGGLNIQTLPALHAGATVTLHRRFEPGATLAAIERDRPTLTVLVPATMRALLDHPAFATTDLSALRMITTGSQIVPVELIEAFHARGVPVAQVYGTTETAPIAVYQRLEDAPRSIGSTGKAALHGELRVVDEASADVPAGTHGEVLIRGPNVMTGYWRNPEATRAALSPEGWFRTGDIGHRDATGDLWIDARADDLIKSGGERVYPAELEDLLRSVPGVRDAAVIGRSDPMWGEVPVAVIVPEPGARPTAEQILAPLVGRIAGFKRPKDVLLVDELPRNALGKVQRFRLRVLVRDLGDGKPAD